MPQSVFHGDPFRKREEGAAPGTAWRGPLYAGCRQWPGLKARQPCGMSAVVPRHAGMVCWWSQCLSLSASPSARRVESGLSAASERWLDARMKYPG
jgi:hypothetical protein